jgi:hypothetical protein
VTELPQYSVARLKPTRAAAAQRDSKGRLTGGEIETSPLFLIKADSKNDVPVAGHSATETKAVSRLDDMVQHDSLANIALPHPVHVEGHDTTRGIELPQLSNRAAEHQVGVLSVMLQQKPDALAVDPSRRCSHRGDPRHRDGSD